MVVAFTALIVIVGWLVRPAGSQSAGPAPNREICTTSDGYFQHRADPRYFYRCDGAYRPTRLRCPDDVYFNEDRNVLACDALGDVRALGGFNGTVTLRAGAAALKDVPFKVTGMSVTMSPGLVGEKVTFKTMSGKVLCIRGTESIGGEQSQGDSIATCDVKPEARGLTESLLRGYKVTYDGAVAKPASASGPVKLIKTGNRGLRLGR
jgi:hypothetical protein